MRLEYKVTTGVDPRGLLMQRVDAVISVEGQDNVRETLMQQVMDTTDAQVRAGLIKLGWTPPETRGWVDIPDLCYEGGTRRVTADDVIKMEQQIRQIADALHL
jgi:hypothetical protein